MTQTPPEGTPTGPVGSIPGTNPDATDPTSQAVPPDDGALAPEDVRTPPPEQNKGSGQFAVFDHDLGQFVSGVGDKATASQAKKDLEDHNGAITDGHELEVREV